MTEPNESALVITSLEVENVKRVRAVHIRPNGSLVVVGGRNRQGKTSVLDSIEMCLRGLKSVPAEPIRRGARSGEITTVLGAKDHPSELTVERRFNASGTSDLVVKNEAGATQRGPQGVLDALFGGGGSIAFDPLEFTRMKPGEQDLLLKRVLGIDFSKLDQARALAFEERKDTNRRVKQLEVQIRTSPDYPEVGVEEISVSEVAARMKLAREQQRARDQAEQRATAAQAKLDEAARLVERLETELDAAGAALIARGADAQREKAAWEALPSVETESLEAQLATAEQTNAKARANQARAAMLVTLDATRWAAQELTDQLRQIDDQKAELLAAAEFPVPGLGFDETGPTLNGLPLEQASKAEQIRLSVAIGFALNPRLRVLLVRDGSLLDAEGLELLATLAAEHEGQVWVERVSDTGEGCSVVIEDGSLKLAAAE